MLIAIGLNHRSAPIEVREQLSRGLADMKVLIEQLRAAQLAKEAMLLSTCNRVELYVVPDQHTDPQSFITFVSRYVGLVGNSLREHLYVYSKQEALHHLFRVISSLDSMILGENQIVSQIRQSFRRSIDLQCSGPVLHRIIERALSVSKTVREQTNISKETVSIGRAGVELARQVLGELSGLSALLIGAGEHGKLVAKNLFSHGLSELVIANRTFSRGVELAKFFNASAIHLSEIPRYLDRVDIVLTSVAGGQRLIRKNDIITFRRRRRYRTLVLIDLSVPRIIDSEIHDLNDVFLFDIDDLNQLANEGRKNRESAAKEAEDIVSVETNKCWKILQGDLHSKNIGAVYHHAERIRIAETQKTFSALPDLNDEQKLMIDKMTRAMISKFLHHPMAQARQLAQNDKHHELQFLLQAMLPTGDSNEE